nr:translation initiation factor 1 [Solanaceae sp. YYL-2022]
MIPQGNFKNQTKWSHEALITELLPNGLFRVHLDLILNSVSGKIRHSFIRILPGDRVKIEVSPYDSTKGRIIYRLHNKDLKDWFFNFTIPFVGIQL